MPKKRRELAVVSIGEAGEPQEEPELPVRQRHLAIWTGADRRVADRLDPMVGLKESELRYRRLFESAKDGILILDGETGVVTDVNPFLIDLLGYTRDEIVGKAFWEFGPFRDTAASKSKFRQLHHVEFLKDDNLPLEAKSGEIRSVEFVTNLYTVADQRVIQCNIREITDRVRAQDGARKEHEEMATLLVALQQRDAEMQAINRLNDLLQTCTAKDEAYSVIALLAGELAQLRPGSLAIMHPEDQSLVTVARWGDGDLMESTFNCLDCWAIRGGKPHEVARGGLGLHCKHFVRQPEDGTYCLPLVVQGETLGLVTIVGKAASGDASRANHHQLAEAMGEAIKLSLSNLRLREKLSEQATHDSLTGLYNVRFLDETLPRELYRALRTGSPLCIGMLDLDHFKRLNDTLGHAAGDAMLRAVGKLLRETSRKSDLAVRYGGEEFLIVLPDSPLAGARQRMEEIRALVRLAVIPDELKADRPMTISCGLAMAGQHGSTAQELIRAADSALYAAKAAGRDRVVVHGE
ncbi:MAG TPA: sensor domain-containing diguanylate cyclase [Gemmatimonadaceae bacterium]